MKAAIPGHDTDSARASIPQRSGTWRIPKCGEALRYDTIGELNVRRARYFLCGVGLTKAQLILKSVFLESGRYPIHHLCVERMRRNRTQSTLASLTHTHKTRSYSKQDSTNYLHKCGEASTTISIYQHHVLLFFQPFSTLPIPITPTKPYFAVQAASKRTLRRCTNGRHSATPPQAKNPTEYLFDFDYV